MYYSFKVSHSKALRRAAKLSKDSSNLDGRFPTKFMTYYHIRS